jgi:hypothetical protein
VTAVESAAHINSTYWLAFSVKKSLRATALYSLLLLSVTRIEELGTSVPLIRNQSQMFFVLLLVDVSW